MIGHHNYMFSVRYRDGAVRVMRAVGWERTIVGSVALEGQGWLEALWLSLCSICTQQHPPAQKPTIALEGINRNLHLYITM